MEVLAFDIGGTKIYCAKINEKGEISSEIEKYSKENIFMRQKSSQKI